MATETYRLSFTAGGLLMKEAAVLVIEYLSFSDWEQAAQSVREQNLLQARTASSATRVLREVRKRLMLLSDALLEALASGSPTDQQQLLWIAACRRYQLLRDFASEVVRKRFLQLDLTLSYDDFDRFLEAQEVWHSEIEDLATTTRSKLRQVTFRMLREAGLLSQQDVIQPVGISRPLARLVRQDTLAEFRLFPVHEADVARVLS